jgi:hypothetical protein
VPDNTSGANASSDSLNAPSPETASLMVPDQLPAGDTT